MIGLDGSPENAKRVAEASLKRLGTDVIDLYYLHRPDPQVPVEESVGAMGDLVREGKVRFVGVSEFDADQLRRANREHPIAALQSEYSLWTRGVETEILPLARELGIGFVPFSPLGKGFLTGAINTATTFNDGDLRSKLPRFTEDARAANQALVDAVTTVATRRGATPGQVALAWLLAQHAWIGPIPGTTKLHRLSENNRAVDLHLAADDLADLAQASDRIDLHGDRYPEQMQRWIDR